MASPLVNAAHAQQEAVDSASGALTSLMASLFDGGTKDDEAYIRWDKQFLHHLSVYDATTTHREEHVVLMLHAARAVFDLRGSETWLDWGEELMPHVALRKSLQDARRRAECHQALRNSDGKLDTSVEADFCTDIEELEVAEILSKRLADVPVPSDSPPPPTVKKRSIESLRMDFKTSGTGHAAHNNGGYKRRTRYQKERLVFRWHERCSHCRRVRGDDICVVPPGSMRCEVCKGKHRKCSLAAELRRELAIGVAATLP